VTLGELARRLECPIEGDDRIEIAGVAKIETAGPGELTFLAHSRFTSALATTKASAVIAAPGIDGAPCAVIRSPSPYLTFGRAVGILVPAERAVSGVHSTAVVDPAALVDPTVSIGAFAVIEAGARVGARTVIYPHVVIAHDAVIGMDCVLHVRATIRERCVLGDRVVLQDGAVVGSDGFGFAQRTDGSHEKIPQVAPVVIESDVEIGANTTIDRPAMGETRIKAGTKIDNLVQIGHGVLIGKHTLLAAQVGVAGSTVLGDHVMFGGQVGIANGLAVGDRAKAVAKSGITNDVDADAFVSGYPAIDNGEWRRSSVIFKKLPEMRRQLMDVVARLEALERKANSE
jgi:UDP-3-O-[3-hydroxymyristoyl] glucosamine N-acyltransferase